VRLKVAASLDGFTALASGASQWITSAEARADGHAWRARACAVLTGIGTVREDDPRLDVRDVPCPRQPDVVLVDSRLELPAAARLLLPGRRLFIYTAVPAGAPHPVRRSELEAQGATIVSLPNPRGKVDLAAMLRDLALREMNEIHVEAGTQLNGSLVREGLVDEFLVYLAPKLLASGRGMAEFGPLTDLASALPLEFGAVDTIGPDLRILARVRGRGHF
jgi:diaminohydroxyphosphoribosylaminopyrimidine deaminase/5-amino-6-(5-phosphoribosylamino)uracil reductase